MLFIFFALPGLAVPLVVGLRLLRRYEHDPLRRMPVWFVFKPVVPTLLAGLLMHLLPWMGDLSGADTLSDAALVTSALAGIGTTVVLLWIFRDQLWVHPLLTLLLLLGDAARWISATIALNGSGFSPTYGVTFSPVYAVAIVLPALYALGVWLWVRRAAPLRAES